MLGRGGDRSLLIGDEREISRRRERRREAQGKGGDDVQSAWRRAFVFASRTDPSKPSNILAHFSFAA
jgi:hypothetical protein